MDKLLEYINDDAVDRAVRIGAGSIYHGCVHNMLHRKDKHALAELYKAAGFVLRADYYRKTGQYIRSSDELAGVLNGSDREILKTAMVLKRGGEADFTAMSEALFQWVQKYLV